VLIEIICAIKVDINLSVAKAGGLQSQGAKGEAVVGLLRPGMNHWFIPTISDQDVFQIYCTYRFLMFSLTFLCTLWVSSNL
jgi:hypothetical protein